MNRLKSVLTIILFCTVLFGVCGMYFLLPNKDFSFAERRKLARFPELSAASVFESEFSGKLEDYLLDHIPFRESFRRINAVTRTSVLGQKDVNGLWLEKGHIFKYDGPLQPKQAEYGAKLIEKLAKEMFDGKNVYYSVIPDKNYYLTGSDHPRFEYEKLKDILVENIFSATYINIFDTLSLESYYKTDSHWSQEKILPTANKLLGGMGMPPANEKDFTLKSLSPFYGVYSGQAALTSSSDVINYLSSDYTDSAKVYGIDKETLKNVFGVEDTLVPTVYAPEKLSGTDGYDIFLSGAQPIVVMECKNAKTDRELILLRDSYGSSISPLMLGAYSKITLVDLRYIPSAIISDYIDIESADDVLFLYSTSLLNSSMLMK